MHPVGKETDAHATEELAWHFVINTACNIDIKRYSRTPSPAQPFGLRASPRPRNVDFVPTPLGLMHSYKILGRAIRVCFGTSSISDFINDLDAALVSW